MGARVPRVQARTSKAGSCRAGAGTVEPVHAPARPPLSISPSCLTAAALKAPSTRALFPSFLPFFLRPAYSLNPHNIWCTFPASVPWIPSDASASGSGQICASLCCVASRHVTSRRDQGRKEGRSFEACQGRQLSQPINRRSVIRHIGMPMGLGSLANGPRRARLTGPCAWNVNLPGPGSRVHVSGP